MLLATLKRDAGRLLETMGYRREALKPLEESAALFDTLETKDDWAYVEFLLGQFYSQVTPHDMRHALDAYKNALTVITETGDPALWALIQSNLVEVYTDIDGDRTENLEQAIQHGEAVDFHQDLTRAFH